MAKFIEEKEIINNHISSYVDRITDFSKYLSGSPTFTTYYNKDMLASTADIGLNQVHEIVGMESPIRYNKINNFPIYNITALDVDTSTDDDDKGTDTDISGDGIVLPDCGITPLIDDCFVMSYDTRKLVFRVIDVQISSIADKVLYKISYTFTRWDLSILEQNQISKEYETRFSNIGNNTTNSKVIIEKSIDLSIDTLIKFKNELKQKYIKYFYNPKLNTFILKDGTHLVYDNFLMEFIKRNKMFIEKKTFLKNIYIEPLLELSYEEIYEYNDSIFNNIELNEYRAYSDNPEYLDYQVIFKPHSIFDVYKNIYDKVYEIKHYQNSLLTTVLEFDYIVKRYFLFLKALTGDNGLNTNPTLKESELKDLTSDILNYKFTIAAEKEYINVPLIINIIDTLIDNLEVLN